MKSNAELYLEAIKLGRSDNLPLPNTRFEKYLYAIITGNASNIPKAESRNDEFLEYIAKNGGIGSGGGNNDDYRHIVFKGEDEFVEIAKHLENYNTIADLKNIIITLK